MDPSDFMTSLSDESLYSATIKKGPLPNVFFLSAVQISVWTYTSPLRMCFLWVSIYSSPVTFPVLSSTSAYSVSTWNTTHLDSFWHFLSFPHKFRKIIFYTTHITLTVKFLFSPIAVVVIRKQSYYLLAVWSLATSQVVEYGENNKYLPKEWLDRAILNF